MKIIIRQENENDYDQVFQLIEKAFKYEELSDHKEQFLVERLRNSDAFIPELSLVAELGNIVVGHILLTRLKITNQDNEFDSLALAPISVLPEYQENGIGSLLIKTAHERAKELKHQSIFLIGHQDYYPRFGYKPANKFGIEFPFEAPQENCMAIELSQNSLSEVSGMVVYPNEFFE